jgi:predicted nucleotidyltransferase
MGSVAYGVSGDASDVDVYGFCIPPKEMVFPHLAGEIPGFGIQMQRFEQWQEHHIKDPSKGNTTYDFAVFSIVKYFQLAMENNPNMIDSLFTPTRCVMHITKVGSIARENRRIFLHKGAWHKFKGYAYAQMSKITAKTNSSNPARAESIAKYGYDVKFAYHVVRLLCEVEQIMVEHDLDLERNKEQLKSIRRGEWTLAQLQDWFTMKERTLEQAYSASTLQQRPDESAIKAVLLSCLEEHYGKLTDVLPSSIASSCLINDLQELIERYR